MQSFKLLHFLVFVSSVSGCVSIFAFALLVGICNVSISAFDSFVDIPTGIVSSAIGLKICAITARIKKYKCIIKKKRKKYDKIVLLGKYKLNTIEFLKCKALINLYISHHKLVNTM